VQLIVFHVVGAEKASIFRFSTKAHITHILTMYDNTRFTELA